MLSRLAQRGAYTASVDVFRSDTLEDFAAGLLRSVLAVRTGPLAAAARGLQGIRSALGSPKLAVHLHDLDLTVPLASERTGRELLEVALTTAERIATHDQRRLVVMIDEFQHLDTLGGESTLKLMRAVIQQQRQVAYLFVGSRADIMRKLFGSPSRAFFRFAVPLELPPIPWAEWARYLTARLEGAGLAIDPAALRLAEEKTEGHPHAVMIVMMVMESAAVRVRLASQTHLSAGDVHHGYLAAQSALSPLYAEEWATARQFPQGAAVLRAIAEGGRPYAGERSRSAVQHALARLSQQGVIVSPARGQYRLVDPLFRAWILDAARPNWPGLD